MNNRLTWLFIISSLFLSWGTIAQEKEEEEEEVKPKKEIKEPITYALRAGIDLYKPIRSQFDKEYQGLEIVGDLKVGERLYVAAEIGNEQRTIQKSATHTTRKKICIISIRLKVVQSEQYWYYCVCIIMFCLYCCCKVCVWNTAFYSY